MSDIYDVVIVGAGPAGCRTAELVSKKGYKVLLIEDHKSVGMPVHCSGLISWRLKEILPELPNSTILNTVNRAKFFSPSDTFELKSKKPVYVIDRAKLDKYLYVRAKVKADVKLGTRFLDYTRLEDHLSVKTTNGTFEARLLVGADGQNSLVAKIAGLKHPDNRLIGIQTTVNGKFDKDTVELWFDKEISPEFFAWVIPLSARKARIGLAAKTNVKQYFDNFLKSRTGKIVKADVGGIINFGLMDTATERVLLVGDAACQVKPFSGGGVIYSLVGAGFCAQACIKALHENRFDAAFLKREYDREWKKKLQTPIRQGMLYSRLLHGSDLKMKLLFVVGKRLKSTIESFDMDLL